MKDFTMKEIVKTSRLAGHFEKLYNKLNADFFGGALEPPVITIWSSKNSCGQYTVFKAWSVKGRGRREVNIAAGTPARWYRPSFTSRSCHRVEGNRMSCLPALLTFPLNHLQTDCFSEVP